MTGARLKTLSFWAVLDLKSELRLTILSALLIAGLLAPALVMTISRASVIDGWTALLATDPRNREVRIIGEYQIDTDMMAQIETLENVGFHVRETSRFIKAIRFVSDAGTRIRAANVRTTKPGDPILGPMRSPDNNETVITEVAAEKFGLETGEVLTVLLRREPKDAPVEILEIPLKITGVIPRDIWPEELVLLSESRSAGIAMWSTRPLDPRPPLYDPSTEAENPWKSVRIYADQVAAAPGLQERLRGAPFNFDTQLHTDQVSKMVNLAQGLRSLALALAILSAVGFAVAVLLFQRLAVARKAETLALMYVAGLSQKDMTLFMLVQSILISLMGLVITVGLVLLLRPVIEILAEALTPGVPPAPLDYVLLAQGALGALGLTFAFSLWACRDIRSLDFPMLLRSD